MHSKEFNECLEILEEINDEINAHKYRIASLKREIKESQRIIKENKENILEIKKIFEQLRQTAISK